METQAIFLVIAGEKGYTYVQVGDQAPQIRT